MNRKIILGVLLLGVGGAIAWMLWQTLHRVEKKAQIKAATQQLPNVQLLTLDSVTFDLAKSVGDQAAVLFFFNPDCEHCQSEAKQVRENAEELRSAKLVWISTENLDRLREFDEKFKLSQSIEKLVVAKIDPITANEKFGLRTFPTVFIYDAAGNLTKKYTGETKIEAILKYLPKS